MKKNLLSMAAMVMLMVGTMSACSEKSPYPGYEKTKSGLYYQFYTQNAGEKPQIGDLIELKICCSVNDTASIIPVTENVMMLHESQFDGDFFEGLSMMHRGDSASFIVNIDSTFKYLLGQTELPKEFTSNDVMRFDVRLDDFYPESEYTQHFAQKVRKANAERAENLKSANPEETAKAAADLADFLAKNNVDVEPTASGLYYVMTAEGNGEKPQAGQMIKIHYTGKLLDGTVFDSSVERGEPISLPIGVGQFIPAWDEGIMMMSKGEKGVLYVPYYLAYGDRQAGDKIVPFSNLIFEVELIDFE